MKFSGLLCACIELRPLLLRPEPAALLLGSGEVVADFMEAGWLIPVLSEHRLVLYAYSHIETCVRRLEAGERPTPVGESSLRPARLGKLRELPVTGSYADQLRGIVTVEPLLLRPEQAGLYVGSGALLEQFKRSGWIEPLYNGPRLVLYSRRQIQSCVARLETGQKPGAYGEGEPKAHPGLSGGTNLIRKARRSRRLLPELN